MQRKIERRPEHTDNRWHSRLIVAAWQLLARAAWRPLARVFWGGECGAEGGLNRRVAWPRGQEDHTELEFLAEITFGDASCSLRSLRKG
jgi:hypothetical protein